MVIDLSQEASHSNGFQKLIQPLCHSYMGSQAIPHRHHRSNRCRPHHHRFQPCEFTRGERCLLRSHQISIKCFVMKRLLFGWNLDVAKPVTTITRYALTQESLSPLSKNQIAFAIFCALAPVVVQIAPMLLPRINPAVTIRFSIAQVRVATLIPICAAPRPWAFVHIIALVSLVLLFGVEFLPSVVFLLSFSFVPLVLISPSHIELFLILLRDAIIPTIAAALTLLVFFIVL